MKELVFTGSVVFRTHPKYRSRLERYLEMLTVQKRTSDCFGTVLADESNVITFDSPVLDHFHPSN